MHALHDTQCPIPRFTATELPTTERGQGCVICTSNLNCRFRKYRVNERCVAPTTRRLLDPGGQVFTSEYRTSEYRLHAPPTGCSAARSCLMSDTQPMPLADPSTPSAKLHFSTTVACTVIADHLSTARPLAKFNFSCSYRLKEPLQQEACWPSMHSALKQLDEKLFLAAPSLKKLQEWHSAR